MKISSETFGLGEHQPFRFSIEASTLGLAPGVVPRMIETALGNGQPFVLTCVTDEAFVFTQALGCITLTIFND